MKQILTTIFFCLIFLNLGLSQNIFEPCKYGQPLINAIQGSYSPTQTMGYNQGRDTLYANIDAVGNDLFCIYSNFKITLDPNQDPSQSAYQNGSGINAEHVFPQSKGAGSEPMKSDLHNIYPSKVSINSDRGSCPFDDIVDSNTDKWYFESSEISSIPTSNIDSYSEKDDGACEFEPREAKKGDIARAVFYFYATYQNVADASFFNQQKTKLLEWHYADLPDSVELARSAAIAQRQGNENPFALDTSLAKRAFFMADASYPMNDANCYNIITNTTEIGKTTWVKLQSNVIDNILTINSTTDNGRIEIFNLNGQLIKTSNLTFVTQINLQDLPTGIFVVRTISSDRETVFKVFKR
jgi:endonuclease I